MGIDIRNKIIRPWFDGALDDNALDNEFDAFIMTMKCLKVFSKEAHSCDLDGKPIDLAVAVALIDELVENDDSKWFPIAEVKRIAKICAPKFFNNMRTHL